MIKVHSGSPVPRYQVFVLGDGAYVVQWTETSVQDLLSGVYREYNLREFGHRITDLELEQLKTAGVIEDFDQAYIWVYTLPEDNRFGGLRTIEQTSNRVRAYYINTTLPADKLDELQERLESLELTDSFFACEHEGLVAVLGGDTMPFSSLKDAETAQRRLQTQLPDLLENAALAFTEYESQPTSLNGSDDDEVIDLEALIASQTDSSVTQGKYAVVACRDDYERSNFMRLLRTMDMEVVGVDTAQKALHLLEEYPVDLLVMDVHLEDMHGWAMLGKFRELDHAEHTHVIVLAEPGADEQVFALTVANVDVYLHKPISIARLRQSVWSILKEHSTE
jgi:CheY-like chemotaxis protein